MKTVPKYAIDANIILRYCLKDDVELFNKARLIFEAVVRGEFTLLIDPVNLAEVVWVMQSFYKVSPAIIASVLEKLLLPTSVEVENKGQYLAALKLFASGLHHFGDACACAAAMDYCDGLLLSFDRKLNRFPGIQRLEQV